jgi:hypothetical protein
MFRPITLCHNCDERDNSETFKISSVVAAKATRSALVPPALRLGDQRRWSLLASEDDKLCFGCS